MAFWEKCFFRTYQSFTTEYYSGREYVAWWLSEADRRGVLPWSEFDAPALATASIVLPSGSQRESVNRILNSRGLTLPQLGAEFLRFQRPELDAMALPAAMDRGDLERNQLGFAVIWAIYGAPLIEFFSRYYLLDIEDADRLAELVLRYNYFNWQYERETPFYAAVLRSVFTLPRWNPGRSVLAIPSWYRASDYEEKLFLQVGRALPGGARTLIYMSVYAGATSSVLAFATRSPSRRVSSGNIDLALWRAWEYLFSLMP